MTNFGYASLVSRERVPFQSPYRQAEFLAYTSPELTGRMNRTVDYRTDYYSLGATLYELLTGTPPFISGHPRSNWSMPTLPCFLIRHKTGWNPGVPRRWLLKEFQRFC